MGPNLIQEREDDLGRRGPMGPYDLAGLVRRQSGTRLIRPQLQDLDRESASLRMRRLQHGTASCPPDQAPCARGNSSTSVKTGARRSLP